MARGPRNSAGASVTLKTSRRCTSDDSYPGFGCLEGDDHVVVSGCQHFPIGRGVLCSVQDEDAKKNLQPRSTSSYPLSRSSRNTRKGKAVCSDPDMILLDRSPVVAATFGSRRQKIRVEVVLYRFKFDQHSLSIIMK